MWLANDKFKEFHRAVLKGEPGRFLPLFKEFFHPENQTGKDLTVCPQCQKKLERTMHPYLEYFVHACPDRHGAWIGPDVSAKVRDLFASQISQSHRRRKFFQGFFAMAAGFGIMLLLTQGPAVFNSTWSRYDDSKIGASYWPAYQFEKVPAFTEESGSIENRDERRYWGQITELLEAGASNRMNLEKILKSHRSPEKYTEAFEVYRRNHQQLLMKLRSVYIPKPLSEFHEAVRKGAENQLVFYAAFTEEKRKHPRTSFDEWLPHPALRACNRELLRAYDLFVKKYPELDNAARRAVESRLCWFDII